MVAPLIVKLIVFSVAKKVTVFLVAKLYGFPRLYRRMVEINDYVNRNNPKRRESVANGLRQLFRLPGKICHAFQRWRGVPEPPRGPPSASGQSSGASPPVQQKQVREIHTSTRKIHVSSLNVPKSSSSLGGLNYISQSIRSHLLGLRGERTHSRIRPVGFSRILPFGITTLAKQKQESKSLLTSLADSSTEASGYHGLAPNPPNPTILQQEALVKSPCRSPSATVMLADESKGLAQERVGLSLLLQ